MQMILLLLSWSLLLLCPLCQGIVKDDDAIEGDGGLTISLRVHVDAYAPFEPLSLFHRDALMSLEASLGEKSQDATCGECHISVPDMEGHTHSPTDTGLLNDFFLATIRCVAGATEVPRHCHDPSSDGLKQLTSACLLACVRKRLSAAAIEVTSLGMTFRIVALEIDAVMQSRTSQEVEAPADEADIEDDEPSNLGGDYEGIWTPFRGARRVFSSHQRIPIDDDADDDSAAVEAAARQARNGARVSPVDGLHAEPLWQRFPSSQGQNVRVGIFDTGLSPKNPHMDRTRVAKCVSFTDERNEVDSKHWCADGHGHGTFGASLIAGNGVPPESSSWLSRIGCRQFDVVDASDRILFPESRFGGGVGLAPKSELFVFKVFTDRQASLTSWFLRAFNAALQWKLDIINFSFGGMDYFDAPFVDKIRELTRAGVTVVTATGNDGPRHGTVYNPADQPEAIAVGSCDGPVPRRVSPFSSRGMTTWEIPYGIGRPRPDVVTFGENVLGGSSLKVRRSCRVLSGTSMASPVATGALAMLTSFLRDRMEFVTASLNRTSRSRNVETSSALLKQILMSTADPLGFAAEDSMRLNALRDSSVFTQGAGAINLTRAFEMIDAAADRGQLLRITMHPPILLAVREHPAQLRSSMEPSSTSRSRNWPWWCLGPPSRATVEQQRDRSTMPFEDDYRPNVTVRYVMSLGLDGCNFPRHWISKYAWPYAHRAMYFGASPFLWNITLYHSHSTSTLRLMSKRTVFFNATVLFRVDAVNRTATKRRSVAATMLSGDAVAAMLDVSVETPHQLPAYHQSDFVSVSVHVRRQVPAEVAVMRVSGAVQLEYQLRPRDGESFIEVTSVPFIIDIIPTPPRDRRLLWDFSRQLAFPGLYVPRDNIRDVFPGGEGTAGGGGGGSAFAEWEGDHPFTNYVHLLHFLTVRLRYYVDFVAHPNMLQSPAEHRQNALTMYSVLLITDPEDYFEPWYVDAVAEAALIGGLRVLLLTDWAHTTVAASAAFTDPASNIRWVPVTAGTHVAAVNELLLPFGLQQATDCVISGPIETLDNQAFYDGTHTKPPLMTLWGRLRSSGCFERPPPIRTDSDGSLCLCVPSGRVESAVIHDDAAEIAAVSVRLPGGRRLSPAESTRVFARRNETPSAFAFRFAAAQPESSSGGGIFVLADSDCIDSTNHFTAQGQLSGHIFCFQLLQEALEVLRRAATQSEASGLMGNCRCHLAVGADAAAWQLRTASPAVDSTLFQSVSRRYLANRTHVDAAGHQRDVVYRDAMEQFISERLVAKWVSLWKEVAGVPWNIRHWLAYDDDVAVARLITVDSSDVALTFSPQNRPTIRWYQAFLLWTVVLIGAAVGRWWHRGGRWRVKRGYRRLGCGPP